LLPQLIVQASTSSFAPPAEILAAAAAAATSPATRAITPDDAEAIAKFTVTHDTPYVHPTPGSALSHHADEWCKKKKKIISAIQASAPSSCIVTIAS